VVDDHEADVLIGREADAAISLGAPLADPSGYVTRIPVRLVAPGVGASGMIELESWNGGLPRLPAFFDELATGWRGWAGTKDWRDDAATFEMSASHDGKGLVLLHVLLRSLPYDAPGTWRVAVEVPIEPGALDAIASRIRLLLAATE